MVLLGHRPMYVLSSWDEGGEANDSDQSVARLLQVRGRHGCCPSSVCPPFGTPPVRRLWPMRFLVNPPPTHTPVLPFLSSSFVL